MSDQSSAPAGVDNATTAPAPAKKPASTSSTKTTSSSGGGGNRPVHPAVLTTFGPGKGSGSSEFSVWAYLTRPRPPLADDSSNKQHLYQHQPHLPNLVTAHSNSLRVYTVLPHAGTLALTAVYDNLAGTICSLDVIPNGMGGGCCTGVCGWKNRKNGKVDDSKCGDLDGGENTSSTKDANNNDANGDRTNNNVEEKVETKTSTSSVDDSPQYREVNDSNNEVQTKECKCYYDGLLLGFAGHPRLSLVYPSTPMVGGGCWGSGGTEEKQAEVDTNEMKKDASKEVEMTTDADGGEGDMDISSTKATAEKETLNAEHKKTGDQINYGLNNGVGQGGVLLASSIIDLTPALVERSMGGTSYLEQDMIVCVSTSCTLASGVDYSSPQNEKELQQRQNDRWESDDPSVSVVLGGGVAIASFSLPKSSRPEEDGVYFSSSSSWWRVASEPYVLPLHSLSTKLRHDFGGGSIDAATAASALSNSGIGGSGSRAKNPTASGVLSPILGHGFGDILDICFLSGYTEPTLLVLHSDPKRGGGRAWAGRLGRTAEVPLANSGGSSDMEYDDDYGSKLPETVATGTKYGLTLTAISLAIHQHRSVVLWSLLDAVPADAYQLHPHPTDGVLVWGVNTVLYVTMGGKIQCALAVNGFARIGCPTGLLPPPSSLSQTHRRSSRGSASLSSTSCVHLEPNPSPLPMLSLQLDGARVGFVTRNVALVCLGNGALHSLELHGSIGSQRGSQAGSSMFMSLSPLGHCVGGLGVTSCLSLLATDCHSQSMIRYLDENESDGCGHANSNVTAKIDAKDELKTERNAETKMPNTAHGELKQSGPQIQTRGLVFIGSRMGDCSLLAFSLNEPIRLVVTDIEAESTKLLEPGSTGKRKLSGTEVDVVSSVPSSEPAQKQFKVRESEAFGTIKETPAEQHGENRIESNNGHSLQLTEEELLSMEEKELYDDDEDALGPNLVSPTRDDSSEEKSDGDIDDDNQEENNTTSFHRRSAQFLSIFRDVRALDSLTGLGPLGPGCYGPVATCSSLINQDDNSVSSSPFLESNATSLFSNAFSSAARHYILPCGFGASGGLAILTTPGRDNVGGSILCEADLCNMSGAIFGLPQSNLVLLGRSNGVGSLVLRGITRNDDGDDGGNSKGYVEEFEELDIVPMDTDDPVSLFSNSADILGKMPILAAEEFLTRSANRELCFSVFLVKDPNTRGICPYAIVIMSVGGKDEETDDKNKIDMSVKFVHHIDSVSSNFFNDQNKRGCLSSVTPLVSKVSECGAISSINFGCVWASGHASMFNISLDYQEEIEPDSTKLFPLQFKVSESIFAGGSPPDDESTDFYNSNAIVCMDVASLPHHTFDSSELGGNMNHETIRARSKQSVEASLSFPPDRLSMHGTWFSQIDGCNHDTTNYVLSENRIIIAICRRSGVLQIYDNDDTSCDSSSKEVDAESIWQSEGCGFGVAILGQSHEGVTVRRPQMHDVEAAEIRFFVSGPSFNMDTLNEDTNAINAAKDAWMLRSLCILVDSSLGDLQLYAGSKSNSKNNRLEFSRVPLSCISRPSEEAGRHLMKLRRRGIVSSLPLTDFRPNRLHRFYDISGVDGLFAATPRPLWFVSERGAPTVVSHKSRHVSPAGGRLVPVSGFCPFQNANKGFITLHERIGRVGSQRLTLFSGLWDMFSPHGLLPGGGICVQKIHMGVTIRHVEFIDDATISSSSRPIYALLVSREMAVDQSHLNDDGLSPEERQRIKDEKEAAKTKKQVEADLGGFDVEQEWVEEIEREDCFEVDAQLGLAPHIPARKYEVWLVDAASQWSVLDKYVLDDFEHGTALKVLYLTDVVEDDSETPRRNLFVAVGTGMVDQDGEDLASKGKILLFQVKKSKHSPELRQKLPPLELVLKSEKQITLGPVTSLSCLCSEDIYRVVVGAGAEVTVEQWGSGKLTQVGFYHAHMQVQEIVIFKTFFLLSDAYDSLHFLVWRESDKSLTLLAKDYEPTQVFAAGLISRGGAMSFVCHDDRQNLQFFQYAPTDAAARGGNKLVCRADFHMGAQTTALNSHWCQSSLLFNSCTITSTLASLKQQDSLFGRLEDDQRFAVSFGTTDGSFGSIVPLNEPTYWRLTALQSVMGNALESSCALSHRSWRLYRRSTRRGGCRSNDRKKGVVDADLLMKFVDLPLSEQEDLASSIGSTVGLVMDNLLELNCAGSVI